MPRRKPEWVVPPNETIVAECIWRGRRVVLRHHDESRHVCDHPKETRPECWMLSMVRYQGPDGTPIQYDPDELHIDSPSNRSSMFGGMRFLADALAAMERERKRQPVPTLTSGTDNLRSKRKPTPSRARARARRKS